MRGISMSTGTTSRRRIGAQAQVHWLILVIVLIALLVVPVQAALNPDFTGTPRSGVSPLSVQFADISTGFVEPVTWVWDFGDGNTSTAKNPIYTYYQTGSFTVKLDITNANGEQATLSQNKYISVKPPLIPDPLIPDFTGTPRSGVAPLTVQFTDASTGPVATWEWTFGDGNTSSKQNPQYIYNEPGTYAVTLIVSNASGEQATTTHNDYITVEPRIIPVKLNPDFNGTPRSGISPLTVQFNDTSTGPHDSWEWDFGDGNTSTEQKPLYTYNHQGSYNIKLIIRNASEDQATLVQDNYITVDPAPAASELFLDFNGTPRSGVSPLSVQFNDASIGFVEPVTYLWDFGDGGTSTERNPLYTYTQQGSHTVTLNISQSIGAPASIAKNKYITVESPLIPVLLNPGFTGTPRSGVTSLTVRFNDTSTGPHDQWQWDFGDGNTSSKQNPQYTYNEPGTYAVTLIISNASGEQATITHNDYISVNPAPPANELIPEFNATPRSGVSPLTVQFNDASTGFIEPVTYLWDFGDGGTSTERNPLYTYTQQGSYTVTLNITQSIGASASIAKNNYITITTIPLVLPVADFFGIPTSGIAPLTVAFTDISTNTPIKWNWSFGDDSLENVTEQNPIHTFTNPGKYTVSLNATNADGSDTQSRSKYIMVNPAAVPLVLPIADFFGVPSSGVAPLTVMFTDLSTNTPIKWNWSFGDDSLENATEQNPVHTYINAGTYTVSLNATNADGSDTQTREEYITANPITVQPGLPAAAPPVADFFGIPTTGIAPLTVTFSDLTTNTPSFWNWSFGDDSLENATDQNPVHTYDKPGTYSVSLNATNADGSDSQTRGEYIKVNPVAVPLAPPVTDFSGNPTSGVAPLTVTFSDLSTNTPTSWNWSFSDDSLENATEQNPVHTYAYPGTYPVSLNASNADGSDTKVWSDYITVSAIPVAPLVPELLIPNFTGTPTSGPAPLIVKFNDTSTGDHNLWEWNFGDGNSSSEQNPLYTYNHAGSYSVTLNVSQAGGDSVSATQEDYITVVTPLIPVPLNMTPLIPNFTGTPTSGPAPLIVKFNDTSTGDHNLWEWNFGDGNSSSEQNPLYTYNHAGSYSVTLNVSQADGDSVSATQEDYITVSVVPLEPPVADFSGKPTSGNTPLTVTFTDVSTNTPTSWNWSFGDDSLENATEQNPVHTYTSIGNYTVTLNATNAAGFNITTKTSYINVTTAPLGPVADFSGTPTSGVAPLSVQFNDTSTGFVNPVTYHWDFGDGSNSTERNPSHTYTAYTPENFTVTLNVTGNYGKTDSMIKSEYISIEIPTIELVIGSGSLPDEALLDQSLPQAQSLPQSKSVTWAQSLPQGVPGYQDQSLPRDISTQYELSADTTIHIPPTNITWSLRSENNEMDHAFWMMIHSSQDWEVKVHDADHDTKPINTWGKMAEYVYSPPPHYVPNGKSLNYALRLRSENKTGALWGDHDIELSGTGETIQNGQKMVSAEFFKYFINLKQDVSSDDERLGTGNVYRIVITFEAIGIPPTP
jgi:PKD repeat protein